ncbi:uncharacterized protein N7479_007259 [Penicillium vulpinum]|uniref:Nucleoporin NSP1 n=1 Tax=Penicillium vulpinum TaxID=29845 RepID=A0A1V6S0K6_9EURO|nr:uncharacterized protein N7479_007259 [Penicillium vulpinum]KAJ5960109.1 hypothetical protein N7479_007259 [Penicillium vulpinum]OQE07561.1 hypothetical protein PENVUL_c013G09882 [Penicillium vulpinum]
MSFSFGAPASSGGSSGSLFGTAGNAFGAKNDNNASGGGLFGNVGASSTAGNSASPSMFGGNSAGGQSTPTFGNVGASNATTSGTSGFSFGGNAPSGTGTQPNSLFGAAAGSQTPNKSTESTTPSQTGNALFGGGTKSMFGNAAPTATPAPAGNGLFGNNSTTPAGPPPASNPPNSLFGAAKPGISTTPAAAPSSTTPATSQAQPSNNMFGGGGTKPLFGGATTAAPSGGLFGANKPAESTAPKTAAEIASKPLFGAAAPAGGAQSSQTPSLFSNMAAPSGDSASKSAFPALGAPPASTANTTLSLGAPATSSATPQKSLFPSVGTATSTAAPSTTPTSAPLGGGLFGAPAPATTPGTAATAAPATTTTPAAPTGGLFGQAAATTQPATSAGLAPLSSLGKTTAAPTPASTTTTAGAAPAGPAALGQSTTGPAPPAQSRLKNKTMDEIITRWATDLGKYQKDFREQAEKVSEWDRLLVDNGTKVQKLYGSTVDADRATQEVERQLSAVEGQQDELSSWLDRYEREVDEMVTKQVGPGESLQGPDQERETTYKLAEKLSERLDEMGKDLTSMIEEVNGASSTLSKTNKADEPISQIVRILNAHLSQLQVIDQGTSELQTKVTAAQKAGQTISARLGYGYPNNGMGNNNSADDFYRSFMQGR